MPGADLRTLVEEQAALRRVAVTVATESTAERVFDVVTEEVARLLGADAANLVSFGPRLCGLPFAPVVYGKTFDASAVEFIGAAVSTPLP